MKLFKSLRNIALTALLLATGVANAAVYQFTLNGAYNASWTLDSTAAPDDFVVDLGAAFFDVPGNFPGAVLGVVDITFFNAAFDGGLAIDDFYGDTNLVLTDGPQLYTGSEDLITFLLGQFTLTDLNNGGTYTLTVTDLTAVPPTTDVPEPASAALLIGGLGMLYASRKRRQAK